MEITTTKPDTKDCKCDHCTYHEHVEEVKARKDPDELLKLVDDLYDRYVNTDFDLDYYKCIFDGSWPDARQMAYGIIDRAVKIETELAVKDAVKEASKKERTREGHEPFTLTPEEIAQAKEEMAREGDDFDVATAVIPRPQF